MDHYKLTNIILGVVQQRNTNKSDSKPKMEEEKKLV